MALEDYLTGGNLLLFLGIVVLGVIIWYLIKSFGSGRIGEERQEERETEGLERDEKTAEKAQKDEKKQCKILDNLFSEIMTILRNSGNKILADQLSGTRQRISKILLAEMSEKMSVQSALQAFRELHALINDFLSKLPNDNPKINGLVEEIKKRQKRYYEDLIIELNVDEDKKKILREELKQVIDEEQGTGSAAA